MTGPRGASPSPSPCRDYSFAAPRLEDAGAIWRLVQEAGALDTNSSYCYLVLCRHFSQTCVTARRTDRLVGFVTALIPPQDARRLFVWQLAVAPAERGGGLAKRMLRHLLERPACRGVTHLETTVAPANRPSRALFAALARDLGCRLEEGETYGPGLFPEPGHDPEQRLLLGPLELSTPRPP
jgi:L-2,4-diaminobutyric acid acetyltransferase